MFSNQKMIEKIQHKIGVGEHVNVIYTHAYGMRNTYATITKKSVTITKQNCDNDIKGTLCKIYSKICK